MESLLSRTEKGDILYAIAYEDPIPGMMYLHAKDIGDARMKVLTSWRAKTWKRNSKIISIAPALGVLEEIQKSIRVFGGL